MNRHCKPTKCNRMALNALIRHFSVNLYFMSWGSFLFIESRAGTGGPIQVQETRAAQKVK